MTAPDLMKGPWTEEKNPPPDIVKLQPKPDPEEEEALEEEEADEKIVPTVRVIDHTAELFSVERIEAAGRPAAGRYRTPWHTRCPWSRPPG